MTDDVSRASSRFLGSFMIDAIRIGGRLEGRFDLGMIYLLVALATYERVTDAELLDWSYALRSVPDDMRRPVSANAISMELHLSRETARRQVAILVEKGTFVRMGAQGVIVPSAHSYNPKVLLAQRDLLRAFFRLVEQLGGVAFPWPPVRVSERRPEAIAEDPVDRVPDFLLVRHIMALVIRLARLMGRHHGRLEYALVALVVQELNLRHFADDPDLLKRYASRNFPTAPDRERLPARLDDICERSGLSKATVRRITDRFLQSRLLEHKERGLIAPARLFEGDDAQALKRAEHDYLVSTINRFAANGIGEHDLKRWSARY